MRPAEVVRRGAGYLERHGVESPLPTAEQLMMSVLGADRTGIYGRDRELDPEEAKAFGRALCRRCSGTPTQHLTGRAGFRTLDLMVRPGVFVPRPETEVLVDVALRMIRDVQEPVVVDVGTGTGAVALVISRERSDAVVHATDASTEAIALAGENAVRLDLTVELWLGDLLDPLPELARLDLVVSNPPYVPEVERAGLPPEVLADPPEAVFGGPEVYARLFDQAAARGAGAVAVEVHEDAAGRVAALARAAGFVDVEVRRDLAGRDRVVSGRGP